MRPFKYAEATEPGIAIQMLTANAHAKFLAGGTNLLDLMKEDVERPDELINITRLNFTQINLISAGQNIGGVSIGGLSSNTDTANDPIIRENFPILSQAILAGASAQIRNMATNGGNINQRTRCPYFFDTAMPCNKRQPGTGCGAREGVNKLHAIFGWSAGCVAVNPSDMCVALAALDAVVKVQDAAGNKREILFADYHRLPGTMPQKDNNLVHGELITSIEIPKNNFAANSCYLKVRDRSSYAFALLSVAAALQLNDNKITQVRIAMGGVAHKPWRAKEAEKFLKGKVASETNFKQAAEMEMKNAKPLHHNKYKVELGKRSIVRALMQAMMGGTNT